MSSLLDRINPQFADANRREDRTRDILLQQAVKAKPTASAGELAYTGIAQAGQQRAANIGKQGQAATAASSNALNMAKVEQAKKLSRMQMGLNKETRRLGAELATLDERVKNRIFDDQLQFKRDELGRTHFNEQQLADFALSKAKSQEELRNYEQMVQQASQRKSQILKAAHARLVQELSQSAERENTEATQRSRMEITQMKIAMEKALEKQKADARNRAAMFGAIGAVGGAVVGTMFGPGAGTAAGATLGATVGEGIGTMFGSTK